MVDKQISLYFYLKEIAQNNKGLQKERLMYRLYEKIGNVDNNTS